MDIYNFSAGPAMLPQEVMQQAQQEFLNWQGGGRSVLEVSHREPDFVALSEHMEIQLRHLLAIPDDYAVLFLPGGAQAQFSFIPMHLRSNYNYAAYLRTGVWSELASQEASNFIDTQFVCDAQDTGYVTIPDSSDWCALDQAAYTYYCDNETVNGVEFQYIPSVSSAPLVADISSNILSRPVDISRYGLLFACSQKNLGAAGVTTIIIKRELLDRARHFTIPKVFDYKKQLAAGSMANTPVTFAWYLQSLVLDWVGSQGGVAEMQKLASQRSALLYDYIDSSDLYINKVHLNCRSRMNVPFFLSDVLKESLFLEQASQAGFKGLKGHRLVGGLRASIYNSMPIQTIEKLIEFMRSFELSHL